MSRHLQFALSSRYYDRQGIRFSQHDAIRPHGTDYGYSPPRRMLAAVKEGMIHPQPPSYRRIDRDNTLCKLPIEHCRNSTSRSADDFKSSTITLFRPADRPLSGTRITETGRQLQATSYQPVESGGMAEFLKRSMTAKSREKQPSPLAPNEPCEQYTFMPEPYLKYSADQMKFNGYAARYLSPRETGSWRYSLRQEPYIDTRGQRPIPATIYSRYRDAHPRARWVDVTFYISYLVHTLWLVNHTGHILLYGPLNLKIPFPRAWLISEIYLTNLVFLVCTVCYRSSFFPHWLMAHVFHAWAISELEKT